MQLVSPDCKQRRWPSPEAVANYSTCNSSFVRPSGPHLLLLYLVGYQLSDYVLALWRAPCSCFQCRTNNLQQTERICLLRLFHLHNLSATNRLMSPQTDSRSRSISAFISLPSCCNRYNLICGVSPSSYLNWPSKVSSISFVFQFSI